MTKPRGRVAGENAERSAEWQRQARFEIQSRESTLDLSNRIASRQRATQLDPA